MLRYLILFAALLLPACASVPSNDTGAVLGPVVEAKLKGSGDPTYIPFSDYTSGNPVVTTEAWTTSKFVALTNVNQTITGNVNVAGGYLNAMGGPIYGQYPKADFPGVWIRRSSGAAQTGVTTLGLTSEYLRLGGGEWNVGSYRMIGFGYGGTGSHAPASIGYQERNKSGNTLGDLVFATRNSTGNTIPTIALRVQYDGQILTEDANYKPTTPKSIPNKAYVDALAVAGGGAPDQIAIPTTGQNYIMQAGQRFVRISPATALAALTVTLPPTPTDGMEVLIVTNQAITAFTVKGATGDTVLAQFTMPAHTNTNDFCRFKYFVSTKTWYQVG